MIPPNNQHPQHPVPRFPLGRCVATPGAIDALEEAGADAADLFRRHQGGDWGTVCGEDRQANEAALREGARLISAYTLDSGVEIWVITEADRSATTITLPEEY